MSVLPSARFGGWTRRCNAFQQHSISPKQFIKNVIDAGGTREMAKDQIARLQSADVWFSDCGKYKVVSQQLKTGDGCCHHEMFDGTIWLSIRIDNGKTHLIDWRDFQAIKNDLCGEHLQGVEIYPQEDVLHDTANVFHLWVLPEGIRLPLGWGKRDVDYTATVEQRGE